MYCKCAGCMYGCKAIGDLDEEGSGAKVEGELIAGKRGEQDEPIGDQA